MEVGEQWVYRLRDSAPSQRVQIVAVHAGKRGSRIEVSFLDEPDPTQVHNVPHGRLRVAWSQVAQFDERMSALERLNYEPITDIESYAVDAVYRLLLPRGVARSEWSPVRNATRIPDAAAFSVQVGVPLEPILERVANMHDEDGLLIAAAGSLLIAEALCKAHSEAVLTYVDEEEVVARHKCVNGGPPASSRSGPTSADWEWRWYLETTKPLHELLRQWCGHRAVTVHERLVAAEREVIRLDELVNRALDALREQGGTVVADILAEEHREEQVTPYNVRTLIERPLSPSEIPVRVVYQRQRRWW